MDVAEDKGCDNDACVVLQNNALADLKKEINTDGSPIITFFGDNDRYEDIDIFDFYAKHGPNMLVSEPIIREVLGNQLPHMHICTGDIIFRWKICS